MGCDSSKPVVAAGSTVPTSPPVARKLPQKVFVIGASGYVGSAAIPALTAKFANVTVGSRDVASAASTKAKAAGAAVVAADMNNVAGMTAAFAGYDYLVVIFPALLRRVFSCRSGFRRRGLCLGCRVAVPVPEVVVVIKPRVAGLGICRRDDRVYFGRIHRRAAAPVKIVALI
jgi:NADPH:quinone reductase-like Zn-dependent oxidoreductase